MNNLIGDGDNMNFSYYSLVNTSPVNNGPATIYQTAGPVPNGQSTDLFTSGIQYSGKSILLGINTLINSMIIFFYLLHNEFIIW